MRFLLLSLVATCHISLKANAAHVIIDPGHGGHDHGAVRGAVRESDITLRVAQYLAEYLRADPRFKASLTRSKDMALSLKQRAELAQQLGGDVLISIHVNSSTDPRAQGGELYFQNQLPPDEESMFLASKENQTEKIEESGTFIDKSIDRSKLDGEVINIISDLQRNYRIKVSSELARALTKNWQGQRKSKQNTIHQAPFYVISNATMPSALVELGFLSNRQEQKRLTDPAYQKKLAYGLYRGLVQFKEFMDK